MVLEKTLESPLVCKNIQPVHPKEISPVFSLEVGGETVETVSEFVFWGSGIAVEGGCSHEIKRHLLPAGGVLANLDSVLKSTDIALPAKVRLVKAMVFPVVMCGCGSWTVKRPGC